MAEIPEIHRFDATPRAQQGGLFIDVPFDVKAAFGVLRPAVWVSLDGYRFQATISNFAGRSYVAVSAEHRAAAGVEPGRAIRVELSSDDAERPVELPAALRTAIRGKKGLLRAWAALDYATRRDSARAIEAATDPTVRAALVSALVSRLASAR